MSQITRKFLTSSTIYHKFGQAKYTGLEQQMTSKQLKSIESSKLLTNDLNSKGDTCQSNFSTFFFFFCPSYLPKTIWSTKTRLVFFQNGARTSQCITTKITTSQNFLKITQTCSDQFQQPIVNIWNTNFFSKFLFFEAQSGSYIQQSKETNQNQLRKYPKIDKKNKLVNSFQPNQAQLGTIRVISDHLHLHFSSLTNGTALSVTVRGSNYQTSTC